jgi:hypothetical protein
VYLVSQAAGDQAAQAPSLSRRDVLAGAGADRRIRGSTWLRIRSNISLRILSDTAITSLRDPGRPGGYDRQERYPPASRRHGDHL